MIKNKTKSDMYKFSINWSFLFTNCQQQVLLYCSTNTLHIKKKQFVHLCQWLTRRLGVQQTDIGRMGEEKKSTITGPLLNKDLLLQLQLARWQQWRYI